MLRFGSDGAVVRADGDRPMSRGAAVPPARAFGAVQTRPCPTSRGHGRFVSFRMGRFVYATAAGPRAGACRLRGGSAASQSLRRRADVPMPHEQGAWALRFVPNGTVCVCDGGRPTSRGLPPAAVFGGDVGGKGNGRRICSAVQKELSRKCRSPLLFHPPLRQGGDLRPFAAFPGRSEIGGMASTETDPESFFESVGKSTGVAHTTG